jgi:membrane associated rhomboid family serine protease
VGILEEIKESYRNGSYLTRLIYINIAVWIGIRIVYIFFFLSGSNGFDLIEWFALPASIKTLAFRPWTIFTYMFLHFEFMHILFNVLWLYWFGRIFLEYHSQKKLLSLYVLGGLLGGVFYLIAYNLFPVFLQSVPSSQLLGASASVIAIVIAISVYVPNHTINLMFIGPVKIKWIAAVSVLLYVIGLSGSNAGGDFAHLGGAFWGWLYMSQLMKGRNIASTFDSVSDYIVSWLKPRRKMNVKYGDVHREHDHNKKKNLKQEEINKILEKISKSGYDSLTREEKEMLFKMGKGKH